VLIASCLNDACRHQGLIDVPKSAAETEVPWFGSKVVCAKCGARGRHIDVTFVPFDELDRRDANERLKRQISHRPTKGGACNSNLCAGNHV
jgi:hypothetical protein